jgi:tetratricopeptide (TPR) repeat protein
MRRPALRIALIISLAAWLAACSTPKPATEPPPDVPAPVPLADDASTTMQAIRFLEQKAREDPLDFVARNKLAGYYMQLLRETGNFDYLRLARRAAEESLAAVPADQNEGGLGALAAVEVASHEFAASRDHAKQLAGYDPSKLGPQLLVADSLLELGEYDEAAKMLAALDRRAGETAGSSLNVDTRVARSSLLRGDLDRAARRFASALDAARALDPPPRETVAWCYWQLGEVAFMAGKYEEAQKRYRDALTTFPNYYRAVASLGRTLAARDDLEGAIAQYEQAVKLLPDPEYIGALGDLYSIAGRERDARAQYDLALLVGRLNATNQGLYSRQIALFLADHGLEPEAAYASAKAEYEKRRDIYGADAVAWTALAANRLDEAAAASKEALRLGTKDAKLFYHAGMIAHARGDGDEARRLLGEALRLNPRFDPLQSRRARETLDVIGGAP